ncbi:MFS transporter [Frateuria sp. GZRe12]|uniref:MFS transporter n=1 Tax=Frateuria sp. GZRe12 TaxID=3351533 RepID=UPI003EDCA167
MLASFTAGGTEMFTMALLARQQSIDESGLSASLVYVATLIGTALMGLIGSKILSRVRPSVIGLVAPLTCFICVSGAYLVSPGPFDYFLAGLVSVATALDFPNINSTLTNLVNVKQRPAAFSALQSATYTVVVSAPVLSAFLLWAFGGHHAMLAIASVYLISAAPWTWLPSQQLHAKTTTSDQSAYGLVTMDRGLRGLLVFRLLVNLIYTGIPVALPYLLSKSAPNHDEYVWLQATSLAALRVGPLAASLLGLVVLNGRPSMVTKVSVWSPVVGSIATIVLAAFFNAYAAIACCLLVGVSQYGSRLTGMVLGPAVTPPNRLAEVILAGDTIVRLVSAAYGLALISLLGLTGGGGIVLAIAAACAIPAPLFLGTAFESYETQLESTDHAF